jgi:hypothetical protein
MNVASISFVIFIFGEIIFFNIFWKSPDSQLKGRKDLNSGVWTGLSI